MGSKFNSHDFYTETISNWKQKQNSVWFTTSFEIMLDDH